MIARLFTFWFRDETPVDRATYLRHGAVLMLVKLGVDALLAWSATHTLWSPLDYWFAFRPANWRESPPWLLPTLLLWSLPFFWAGITLTTRRLLDAARSPWLSLFFVTPVLNWMLLLWLSVEPSRRPTLRTESRAVEARTDDASLIAVLLPGIIIGLAMIAISVYGLQSYSAPLMFSTPFCIGAVTGWMQATRRPSHADELLRVVAVELAVLAGIILVVAIEGVLCLAMVFPIALGTAWLGARLGRNIARAGGGRSYRAASLGMLALPAALLLDPERQSNTPTLHEVRSSVEIDADAMTVWRTVLAFPPIPAPTELLFRAGIAYPMWARIEGSGVGTVRYCVFSTGPFVEPITVWDPGRRLAFDVRESPMPLREVSFYERVIPPHLHGFLQSRRGEFRFVALPNGRTRLEGSTWYALKLGPEGYWQLYGDWMIHRIHVRVLDHVKAHAERSVAGR
jgi:uncharacterized membrane protein YhaH (DUF805 family)